MAHVCSTEHWNWDTWTGEGQEEDYGEEEHDEEEYDAAGLHCDDEGFVVSWLVSTESFLLSAQLVRFVLVKRNSLTRSPFVKTDGCRL